MKWQSKKKKKKKKEGGGRGGGGGYSYHINKTKTTLLADLLVKLKVVLLLEYIVTS